MSQPNRNRGKGGQQYNSQGKGGNQGKGGWNNSQRNQGKGNQQYNSQGKGGNQGKGGWNNSQRNQGKGNQQYNSQGKGGNQGKGNQQYNSQGKGGNQGKGGWNNSQRNQGKGDQQYNSQGKGGWNQGYHDENKHNKNDILNYLNSTFDQIWDESGYSIPFESLNTVNEYMSQLPLNWFPYIELVPGSKLHIYDFTGLNNNDRNVFGNEFVYTSLDLLLSNLRKIFTSAKIDLVNNGIVFSNYRFNHGDILSKQLWNLIEIRNNVAFIPKEHLPVLIEYFDFTFPTIFPTRSMLLEKLHKYLNRKFVEFGNEWTQRLSSHGEQYDYYELIIDADNNLDDYLNRLELVTTIKEQSPHYPQFYTSRHYLNGDYLVVYPDELYAYMWILDIFDGIVETRLEGDFGIVNPSEELVSTIKNEFDLSPTNNGFVYKNRVLVNSDEIPLATSIAESINMELNNVFAVPEIHQYLDDYRLQFQLSELTLNNE